MVIRFLKQEANHLLDTAERWTQLDVRYFAGNASLFFLTQTVLILASFALFVGFARLGSKELLGQFQFVLAVVGVLSVLAMPGANTAVLLGVSQGKEGTLQQGVKFKIRWCFLGVLGLLGTAAYFFFIKDAKYLEVCTALAAATVFFPLLFSLDVIHSFFAGRKRISWSCAFQLITESGSSLAALLTLFLTRSLVAVVVTYFAVRMFGELAAYVFGTRHQRNREEDNDFKSFSAHMTLINLIPYIKTYFDKLIVTYFLGFATTAVYAIAVAVSEQVYAISKHEISPCFLPELRFVLKALNL